MRKLLTPLSWVFYLVIKIRRWLYQSNIFKSHKLSLPVIVVGNIEAGGTGKTPFVIYLVGLLQQQGFKPGVISRGYKSKAPHYPFKVTSHSDPVHSGDEPLLIAKNTQCPVYIDANRVNAAKALIANEACDIIVSDDGLQHYALQRDLEIVCMRKADDQLMPVGRLREPTSRLKFADLVFHNEIQLQALEFVNVKTEETAPLTAFKHQNVHAVAGIAHPGNFFASLKALNIETINHPYPDHYPLTEANLHFDDTKPILMTEKDAIKLKHINTNKCWYLKVKPTITKEQANQLINLLQRRVV